MHAVLCWCIRLYYVIGGSTEQVLFGSLDSKSIQKYEPVPAESEPPPTQTLGCSGMSVYQCQQDDTDRETTHTANYTWTTTNLNYKCVNL